MSYRNAEGNGRGQTWGIFSTFSMEVVTKITISHKQHPLFTPRFEPRTSGMRNSDNYSTAFMNYALSILTAYLKRNLQCTFELINVLSCINIPSDLKYFSLRTIFRLTHALKPTVRKGAMKLRLNRISSIGTMTGYGLENRGSISNTEGHFSVCQLKPLSYATWY
jgi:hypothetical protein